MTFSAESRLSGTDPGRTRTRYRGTGTALALRGAAAQARLRSALARVRQEVTDTVSPAGWLMVAIATAGLGLGLPFGWLEFVVAGVVAAILLALSVPFLFSARAYHVDLHLERDHVVAGGQIEGEITVRNPGTGVILPGRVDVPIGEGLVDIAVPLLRGGHGHTRRIVVPTPRRGIIAVGPARTVRGDPLGILTREASWEHVHTVYVHPETTALLATSLGFVRDLEGQSSRSLVDADISFHAIREYQPGDAQRQIHWKSTAKTGTLMVRQFEETRRSRMLVALALREDEYGTEEEFELAVSAAGSLGLRGLRDGRDVDLVVSGDVPALARRTLRTIRSLPSVTSRTLLDALAGVQRSELAGPLADVASLTAESIPDISITFLVCGSTQTARTLQTAALSFPPQVVVVAVVCNPEAEPSRRRLGTVPVLSIGLLEDLRHLLARGAKA